MAGSAPAAADDDSSGRAPQGLRSSLGPQERAVLSALLSNRGRVVGRRELSRHAGLAGLNDRRCDSLLVGVRRALGPESIVTVRSRGWRLSDDAEARAAALLDPDGATA